MKKGMKQTPRDFHNLNEIEDSLKKQLGQIETAEVAIGNLVDWSVTGDEDIHNDRIEASNIDHDALDNFVANKHLDWTIDKGATNIHKNNVQILDEDDMSGNDATKPPSQQSVKAYFDNAVDQVNKVVKTKIGARVYLSADQLNIVNATATKILFNTEDWDFGNDFDAVTNNRFVAPVSGYYYISASLCYTAMITNRLHYIKVYKNGTGGTLLLQDFRDIALGSGATIITKASDIIYLAANDYIEVFAYHLSGVDSVDIDANKYNTFLSVWLRATA